MMRVRAVAVVTAVGGLIVALAPSASALPKRWDPEYLPPPAVFLSGQFASVSCATATSCVAVGKYTPINAGGPTEPFANVGSGTSWMKSIPDPIRRGREAGELVDVSCPAANLCVAVGDRQYETDGTRAVVETFNGSKWAQQDQSLRDPLLAVSCPTTTFCVAGSAHQPELWNGTTWTAQPAWPTLVMSDLYCTSSTFCLAVGLSNVQNRPSTYQWDGTRWTDVTPSGFGLTTRLNAVDCIADTCRVAGATDIRGADRPFVDTFTDGHWTSPAVLPASTDTELDNISCASTSSCLATGHDVFGRPLALSFDGTTWSNYPSPGGQVNRLDSGLECHATPTCIFAAQAREVEPYLQVQQASGSGWIDAHPKAVQFEKDADAVSVSCVDDFCALVGVIASGDDRAYAELRVDSRWQAQVLPTGRGQDEMQGVSCVSAAFCVAVGRDGGEETSWVWNGTKWSAVPLLPVGSNGRAIASVSCVATTFCLAVGRQQDPQNGGAALVEKFDGQQWTAAEAPPSPGRAAALTDVSCSATFFCAASGETDTAGFAARLNGSRWTVDPFAELQTVRAISCLSARNCYVAGGTGTAPVLKRFDGTSWANVSVPDIGATAFQWVSCGTANHCVVGSGDTEGSTVSRAAIWNGTSWTETGYLLPAGGKMADVSCTGTYCETVGVTLNFGHYGLQVASRLDQ